MACSPAATPSSRRPPLYYAAPPEMVRGVRQYLYDARARAYLDCVNNVAVTGHSHPRITAAATRQMRLLNTNSRFLYGSMTRYAERLAALLPPGLDRVFLVSTGSEANDLALRLARAATGRADVLCIQDAYHGWTTATYEVTTSSVDNPLGAESQPEHIHPVVSPDTYRGPIRAGEHDVGPRYADSVRETIAATRPPAAFICESLYGNAGGIVLPDGYLQAAYAHVRAGRRNLHRRRGAGRLRPARRALLGLRAAGRACRTSSPSPRRPATAPRRGRDHDGGDRRRARGPGRASSRPSAAARSRARSASPCST